MVNTSEKYSPEYVMSLLSKIPDPEIPVINIRELGILQRVESDSNGYIIHITPTYTACPAMKMLENQIIEVCKENGIINVKVILSYSPAWTTDWISSEAKEKLRLYGIAPPLHKSCKTSVFNSESVPCPRCSSLQTEQISHFGSTACKALYKCKQCFEPFDYFKCH